MPSSNNQDASIIVQGSVTSGFGKGKEFVSLEGYARQFESRLGYEPYPGTLNVDIGARIDERLEELQPIRIDGWESGQNSFGAVNCYPASIPGIEESIPLHVVVPDRTDHDTSTLELLSPLSLRDRLSLSDDTQLEIAIHPHQSEP